MPFSITPDWLILSGVFTKMWSKSDWVVSVFLVGSSISWIKPFDFKIDYKIFVKWIGVE